MSFRIEPLSPSNAAHLPPLIDAHAEFERLDGPTTEAKARLVRDGLAAHPKFLSYLAYEGEYPVGYAMAYLGYSSFQGQSLFFLEDMFLRDEVRGRGWGKALFRHLVGEAIRLDCCRMEWYVQPWNTFARTFYDRHGARPLDIWMPYRLDLNGMHAVVSTP